MELTLNEALQKAVEAHKSGQVQEAIRLYTAILQAKSKHPDANHNMGVLAVGFGQVQKALPYFKIALETKPSNAQYWLSYIDALIQLDRMNDAKSVLDQAKIKGAKDKAFDELEQRLNLPNKVSTDPSQDQLQHLINVYQQGQLQQALDSAKKLLSKFPNSSTLYNIQGAANAGLGHFDAAIENYKQALKIKPDFAEAYNNMGSSVKNKGKLEAAIDCYKKALKINPSYAEAYNNIGNALNVKGDLEASIDSFKQALKIKPDYAEAYNNMGVALKDKGNLEAAIDCYKRALKINPNYAEGYNNMGSALDNKGDSRTAIECYSRALKIDPNYTKAYHNMGIALNDIGDLEAALDNFKKALKIKPDYAEVWNNLAFPLRSIKLKGHAIEELLPTFNPQANSKHFQIEKSVLSYRLHLGEANAERSLNEACSLLSTSDNATIRNPEVTNNSSHQRIIGPDKIVSLVHFGRSGTGLFHSLIDGHPEVSTMPSIYFSEFFNPSTWEKIVAGGWGEMVDRFIVTYEVLFDASARNPIESKSKQRIEYLGKKEGMANLGDQRDEVLRVDKALFRKDLNRLMTFHDDLDVLGFFKLAHTAYGKCLKDRNHKHLIFYHIHNPDVHAKLNFVQSAPNANWVMMVREPIQACEAWIRIHFQNNERTDISTKIITMLFEIDNVIYHKQNTIGVRLEDLKESPRETLTALCDWMGIKETESLYKMTAQGKKWWGDSHSPDYAKDGMEPFGTTSIRRKVGSVFTENDQFILRTLFYPFSVQFGYVEANPKQFKEDLKAVRPMLDEMFGFEITMADRTKVTQEQFMKSGSYLYLRSGLIDRWNVLAEFNTYSNMINPLKINFPQNK